MILHEEHKCNSLEEMPRLGMREAASQGTPMHLHASETKTKVTARHNLTWFYIISDWLSKKADSFTAG